MSTNDNEYIFKIKRSLIDSKERTLIVSPKSISYETGVVGGDIPTVLKKEQITDIRYGIIRSNVCFFKFQLFIRNNVGEVLEISFSSFSFGTQKDLKIKAFHAIINAIWKYYFSDYVKQLYSKIKEGEKIELCNVVFENNKVILYSQGLIKQKKYELAFDNTVMKIYKTHFVLYSSKNPVDINKRFTYIEDWNAVTLFTLFDMLKR